MGNHLPVVQQRRYGNARGQVTLLAQMTENILERFSQSQLISRSTLMEEGACPTNVIPLNAGINNIAHTPFITTELEVFPTIP